MRIDTPANEASSSVAKALALLRAVSLAEPPAGFNALLERTGLPKATLHRLLRELADAGLVRHHSPDRTYRPALGLLELASRAWDSIDLRQVAARHVDALWHSTQETVHVAVRDDIEIIYVDKRESPKALRLFSSIGRRGPLYCTGVGKAIFAHLPAAERDDVLARLTLTRHTPSTITSRAGLRAEFERIRRDGVAFDRAEHEEGIVCVAAPIFDRQGHPVASVSVTAPAVRMNDDRVAALAPEVRSAAERISRDLAFSNCPV
ncbi:MULTISPECIES: IclR family transcriptional regulator [Acidiphilium]|jgi:DNA-binding IclR family transcriptional regulator|uniref:Transcriptional regulator, IclR family n=2 Tax=Acidiphilium TaxID=522 RepID=A5G0Q3_ACICJ|nr:MULTISPECIES: IclR family transcriptional regulator [Acidiphilium]MBU6356734.1 IclR family transcriptional regulator [Rhodospirillales bacterium]ABQ31435.1 transcriptional regulator, IclR family [Acidiphilium cryptum JF-5]EGO93576.1 Regulatory protein, IclR [Acidiphilium sp. PM]KDM67128.1 transcriptional regulator KdgR [Acidiphilium sp. JA12-A1]MDE2327606.1 IclR family transcriptional regulator [Rhodospirillales bacterium]